MPTGRDLALVFFKRGRIAVSIVIVTVLATAAYAFLIREDSYLVTARLMVRGSQSQEPPPNLSDASMAVGGYRFQEVGAEAEILQSSELVTRIVDRLHMDRPAKLNLPSHGVLSICVYHLKAALRNLRDTWSELMISAGLKERLSRREQAIARLQKSFSATPVKDTNVILLTLDLPYRVDASRVLNAWIDFYQRFREELYRGRTGQEFFLDELNRSKAKLTAAEDAERGFDGQNQLSDPAKEEQVLLEQLAQAQQSLRESRIAQELVEGRIAAFSREAGKADPQFVVLGSGERDTLLSGLLMDLAGLQRERERLRLTDLDSSARIVNNRAQFQQLLDMATRHLNSLLQQRQEETAVRAGAVRDIGERLQSVHFLQTEQSRLKRNVATTEAEYLTFMRRYEEARATAGLDRARIGQVAVVASAIDPLTPAGIPKSYLLLAALAAGMLAALLWLTLAEYFDNGVYTPAHLENILNAPVIAVPAHA
jgi:uncharacterized protein involved in exopolysaccharide biosynthesis